jgi:hypothetical protein
MAVTSSSSGTQTAVISTEHTLATVTAAGSYILVVDTVNLATGDCLELKLKTKATSTSSSQLAYSQTYAHAQVEPIKYSMPVPIDTELVCTLTQTSGTGRNFPWNLLVI